MRQRVRLREQRYRAPSRGTSTARFGWREYSGSFLIIMFICVAAVVHRGCPDRVEFQVAHRAVAAHLCTQRVVDFTAPAVLRSGLKRTDR
jgi:hypothetical protein